MGRQAPERIGLAHHRARIRQAPFPGQQRGRVAQPGIRTGVTETLLRGQIVADPWLAQPVAHRLAKGCRLSQQATQAGLGNAPAHGGLYRDGGGAVGGAGEQRVGAECLARTELPLQGRIARPVAGFAKGDLAFYHHVQGIRRIPLPVDLAASGVIARLDILGQRAYLRARQAIEIQGIVERDENTAHAPPGFPPRMVQAGGKLAPETAEVIDRAIEADKQRPAGEKADKQGEMMPLGKGRRHQVEGQGGQQGAATKGHHRRHHPAFQAPQERGRGAQRQGAGAYQARAEGHPYQIQENVPAGSGPILARHLSRISRRRQCGRATATAPPLRRRLRRSP